MFENKLEIIIVMLIVGFLLGIVAMYLLQHNECQRHTSESFNASKSVAVKNWEMVANEFFGDPQRVTGSGFNLKNAFAGLPFEVLNKTSNNYYSIKPDGKLYAVVPAVSMEAFTNYAILTQSKVTYAENRSYAYSFTKARWVPITSIGTSRLDPTFLTIYTAEDNMGFEGLKRIWILTLNPYIPSVVKG